MSKTKIRPCFHQRSRIDIMACILKNSNESSNKISLLQNCNLNFSQLNVFIDCLVEARFLEVSKRNEEIEIFKTTEKGEEFLRDYEGIKEILDRERRRKT